MTWDNWVLTNEVTIRLSFFFGIFAIMAIWEILSPKRVLKIPKGCRWANNLGLVVLNSVVLRFLFPAAAVGVAAFAQQQGWGLFNYQTVPFLFAVVASVILMDLVIYIQHVMVHAFPLLWRLHRVHHADLDYDLTTGARFHTLEIILSMLIKFATILLLGPPLIAVVIFEVLLNAMAMFNHGNIRLPRSLDRVLRWFVVTPDMHRIHHSVEDDEANSNFGFNLSIWDRLFGTYRNEARAGHMGIKFGIQGFDDPKQTNNIIGMLLLPFKGKITGYAINTRRWKASDKEQAS